MEQPPDLWTGAGGTWPGAGSYCPGAGGTWPGAGGYCPGAGAIGPAGAGLRNQGFNLKIRSEK
jgi:hypothetical protein